MMKKLLFPLQGSFLISIKPLVRQAIFAFGLLAFSLSGFGQGPADPSVYAGEDVILDCGEECTELTAEYIWTGETTSYEVSEIPYAPPFPFTGGTPVSVNIDDRWSSAINLPFDFCFYGQVYTQMIIGSNGVVSFELNRTGTNTQTPGGRCEWDFDESIPDTKLFWSTIFGPYMDINPAPAASGQINWAVFGEAPLRTMVVSFPNIVYFGSACSNLFLTSQIVMYEATNVIEVYVEKRPDGCSWNDGNAVIGIQNQDGTMGETPPGRNTGDWAAYEEAWRFTPNGNSNVIFSWLDENGEVISHDTTITVCPTEPVTTYTAQAVYTNCNGDIITQTDDVTVTLGADFTVDLGEDQMLCDVESYEITAELDGADPQDATFLWNTGETTQSITVTETGTYTVEVTVGECSLQKSVYIQLDETPVIDLGEDIETCSTEPVILDATPSNMDPGDAEFEWSKDGEIIPGEAGPTLEVTESGLYSVTVSKNECIATDSVSVLISEGFALSLGGDQELCDAESYEITAELDGADPQEATFLWSTGETTQSITVTETGTYSVEVTVGECTLSESVTINFNERPDIDLGEDFESCFNEPLILDASPSNYDPEEVTYEWSFNGTILEGETGPTLEVTETGLVSVIVTYNDCAANDSVMITMGDGLSVSLGDDLQICPNETHVLTASTSDPGVSFVWFLNGELIEGADSASLEISLEPGTTGTQTYTVEISVPGCSATDSVDVTLYPIGNCVISQGISPNGDGYNDSLDLTFLHDRTGINKLQIFNRLGTLVFDQTNYTNQWHGQTNGGKELPTGTYFYVIEFAGEDPVYGTKTTGWIYLNTKK